jgi:ABC-type multidrug transport system ATPase subunit
MMAVIRTAGVGYLGPDGAGKATTIRCLLGMSEARLRAARQRDGQRWT